MQILFIFGGTGDWTQGLTWATPSALFALVHFSGRVLHFWLGPVVILYPLLLSSKDYRCEPPLSDHKFFIFWDGHLAVLPRLVIKSWTQMTFLLLPPESWTIGICHQAWLILAFLCIYWPFYELDIY
jgi:hypothetical protein